MIRKLALAYLAAAPSIGFVSAANAALITDPNDPRSWQGATVGTFAALYYGSDTLANRQLVVDNHLLDDGIFDPTGSTGAPMIKADGVSSSGMSLDLTGTGGYAYTQPSPLGIPAAGNFIDNHWVQVDNVIGDAIWDLGAPATKAAIFNTIDHGPLPQEAIESTVYLSNDKINWIAAVTERVWLEGFMTNTAIQWDGFAYAVGTGSNSTFRYASIIWGGPGGLQADGDNEINGVLGLDADFTPTPREVVPEPGTLALIAASLLSFFGLGLVRRRPDA